MKLCNGGLTWVAVVLIAEVGHYVRLPVEAGGDLLVDSMVVFEGGAASAHLWTELVVSIVVLVACA